MACLDPSVFFLWDQPRTLIDIRQRNAFLRGSMENAISMPVTEHDTIGDFKLRIQNLKSGESLHLIDMDGGLSGYLSGGIDLDYLEGGYRLFKAWRDKAFEKGPPVRILGGYTGSGKTELLRQMKLIGHQVIDLEELASHKGSAFGYSVNDKQPLHENFQNRLLKIWLMLNPALPVWMEEKGPFLGMVGIPLALQKSMQTAPMVHLDVPFEERLMHLVKTYASLQPSGFRLALRQLESRMGTGNSHKAWHYFNSGLIEKSCEILLKYYDSAYEKRRQAGWPGTKVRIPHSHDDFETTIKKMGLL